jgi:hypothetical protein
MSAINILRYIAISAFVGFSLVAQTAAQDTRSLARDTGPGTDRRIALVIGNAAYANAPRLANPVNDARDMAAALRQLGFEVLYGEDQRVDEMKRLIKDFGVELARGGKGLFYYAGHGVQLNGHNYLVPVEAANLREATIEFEAVDVNRVLAEMDAARNGFNIVILDACRNNPLSRSWRDTSGGLALVKAPTGTFIAYATAPDSVASDGPGRNGLYTEELLKQIRRPGVQLEEVFKNVRREVRRRSNDRQVPWESSSVEGEFYFAANASTPARSAAAVPDTPVKLLYHPQAAYTDSARQNQVQGKIRLEVEFLDTGEIGSIRPLNRLEFGLTEQAISAARRIRFTPATAAGTAVTVKKVVEYNFSLY